MNDRFPRHTHTASSNEAIAQSMDELVDELSRLMRPEDIPGFRYDQLSIARLPEEILGVIFYLDADVSRPNHEQHCVRDCWMRLGHVCRVWRFVITNMPALWARDVLAFGFKRGVFDVIFARAQETPLDLCFHQPNQKTLTLGLPLIPRAKELYFYVETEKEEQAVPDKVSACPLPLLHKFTLDGLGYALKHKTASLVEATNLCYLEMRDTYLHPPVNGNLVSLIVELRSPLSPPSLNDIVHVLSQNLGLRMLELKDAFREREQATLPFPFMLPRLAKVSFQSSEQKLLLHGLINLLRMPNLQHFTLHDSLHDVAAARRTQLSTLLRAVFFSCAGSPVITRTETALDIEQDQDQLYVKLGHYHEIPSESSLTFRLNSQDDGQQLLLSLQAVLSHLSDAHLLDNVRKLRLANSETEMLGTERWEDMLSQFTKVDELEFSVSIDSTTAILDVLARTHETPVMPLLRRIRVDCKSREIKVDEMENMKKLVDSRQVMLEIWEAFLGGPYLVRVLGPWEDPSEDDFANDGFGDIFAM